jgi:predicted nucleic acid-binding protein
LNPVFVDTGGWIALLKGDDHMHASALAYYADIPLSLTDATSAAVARRSKANEVFGFDRHFRALGFDLQPVTL